MSASVRERIKKVADHLLAKKARGEAWTIADNDLMRKAIRRACALRIVDLVSEGVGMHESVKIAFLESGMNVTEEQVKTTAETFERNWDEFVRSAPVEIVSDAEFAEILRTAQKGTVLA